MTMNHGAPIQDALMLSSGSLLFSAGDTTIKVWDVLAGGRLVHEFSHHQKTITSLCLDTSSSRLMSASLDHMVKFYDVATYEVVHSTKYPEPILSMALSPDASKLAVGQTSGQLIVRRRELRQVCYVSRSFSIRLALLSI
jgi:U3 small nucleolar RNA-associated protein 15